jgi:hypothetical protein
MLVILILSFNVFIYLSSIENSFLTNAQSESISKNINLNQSDSENASEEDFQSQVSSDSSSEKFQSSHQESEILNDSSMFNENSSSPSKGVESSSFLESSNFDSFSGFQNESSGLSKESTVSSSRSNKDDIDSFPSFSVPDSSELRDSQDFSSSSNESRSFGSSDLSEFSEFSSFESSSEVISSDFFSSFNTSDSVLPDFSSLESSSEDLYSSSIQIESESKEIPLPVCSFPLFNFTEAETLSIWNYVNYTDCKTKSNDSISIENNKFIVKCESGLPPKYFNDPLRPEKLAGSTKIFASWSTISPDLSKSSFAFVKCQENSAYAFTFLKQNKSISDQASKLSSELQKSLNISSSPNLKVLLLVFDSVSRGSVYRNWPKTVKYLKSLNGDGSICYEFTNPGIPELHTQDNMAQMLYGETKKKMQKTLGMRNPPMTVKSRSHLEYQKKALWKYFSSQGFVTFFLHDAVWDFLSYLTGHDIETDHFFGNFWKAAWSVYGFSEYDNCQKCMGLQNSHNISFGHIFQFFKEYPNNHQFAYVHLNAAHEKTGNIRTVDLDLKRFLINLTELFKKRQEEFVVFLMGDHGSSPVKLQFDIRGFYEYRQPMSFLILSPGVAEERFKLNLKHNLNQMFSRFDVHLTLKQIAHWPYGGLDAETYEKMKKSFEVDDVSSLLSEKISENRTCRDIGVEEEYCPCSGFRAIDEKDSGEIIVRGNVIYLIEEFLKSRKKNNSDCIETILNVTEYKKFNFNIRDDGWETLYKVKVRVGEMTGDFYVRSCTEQKIKDTKNVLDFRFFTNKNFTIDALSVFFQVFHVEVHNSCANDCFC